MGIGTTKTKTDKYPYATYAALISQSGILDPTVEVLENGLYDVIVWTRISTGKYQGNLLDAFPLDKTFTFCNSRFFTGTAGSKILTNKIVIQLEAPNNVILYTTDDGDTLTDGILSSTPIEIRFYL